MDWTSCGGIGCELKVGSYNSADKTDSIGSNINSGLTQYVTKTLVNREVREKIKHVDPVLNSIKTLPLADTNSLSNTYNILSFYLFWVGLRDPTACS